MKWIPTGFTSYNFVHGWWRTAEWVPEADQSSNICGRTAASWNSLPVSLSVLQITLSHCKLMLNYANNCDVAQQFYHIYIYSIEITLNTTEITLKINYINKLHSKSINTTNASFFFFTFHVKLMEGDGETKVGILCFSNHSKSH